MRTPSKSNIPFVAAIEMFHVKHCNTETGLVGLRLAIKVRLLSDAKIAKNNIEQIFDINAPRDRSEEHTSELQSHHDLVCRLLLEKKNQINIHTTTDILLEQTKILHGLKF